MALLKAGILDSAAFSRKHRLTKLCDRVSLRMLENAAEDNSSLMRGEFDERSKRVGISDSDRGWSAWMRDVEHPKRSIIVSMIVSLAAADFWCISRNSI